MTSAFIAITVLNLAAHQSVIGSAGAEKGIFRELAGVDIGLLRHIPSVILFATPAESAA
jgi:hypothetical protein